MTQATFPTPTTCHIAELPPECIRDCGTSGYDHGRKRSDAVVRWVQKLDLRVARQQATRYLTSTGNWHRDNLAMWHHDHLKQAVLWEVCGNLLANHEAITT